MEKDAIWRVVQWGDKASRCSRYPYFANKVAAERLYIIVTDRNRWAWLRGWNEEFEIASF